VLRHWIGTISLALLGVLLTVLSVAQDWPTWAVVLVVIVAMASAALTIPLPRTRPPVARTAFIKGSATGSHFDRIWVEGAEAMVDGDADNAVFRSVVFNARSNTRRLRALLNRSTH